MSESIFSPYWYRVKALRPSLRSHITLHRHYFRGAAWYVAQDRASIRHHRFNSQVYHLICLLDGKRSVEEIWQTLSTRYGDDAPSQDDTISTLARLYHAEIIRADVTPDAEELFQRHHQRSTARWKSRIKNPLAMRFSLWDPNRVLHALLPLGRFWLSAPLMLAQGLLLLAAALLAGVHWPEIRADLLADTFNPQNLIIMVLLYPLVKLLHELGHGLAARTFGGEVHEMGVMFLLFVPLPYVDASCAAAFKPKHQRALVAAAGMLVELNLAALALLVWLAVEPGVVRSCALNIMLIGSVATLFFNGNPLLRYDGYYVLSDLIEIPNLATRANRYIGYLTLRYVYGVRNALSPVTAPGEARWLFGYAIAAFSYRMLLMFTIALFLAESLLLVGVALASWTLLSQLILPALSKLRALRDDSGQINRVRLFAVNAGLLITIIALTAGIPFPSWTGAQGVIWPAEKYQLRAQQTGFVRDVLVESNSAVSRGQALVVLQDDELSAEIAEVEAQLRELEARRTGAWTNDRVAARIVADEIAALRGDLAHLRSKQEQLIIRATADGVFVPVMIDPAGQLIQQGALLGYVVSPESVTARVAVGQDDVGHVRDRSVAIEVRLVSEPERVFTANLLREVPQGSNRLPSKVLSVEGGGPWPANPDDSDGLLALDTLFQFELGLPVSIEQARIGTRIYVRFDHGTEVLAVQWYRSFRQLLLSRFDV